MFKKQLGVHYKTLKSDKYSKVKRLKINIQKSVPFLYTILSKKEIRKSTPSQQFTYLEVNIIQKVKGIYDKKKKTLRDKIEIKEKRRSRTS